YLLWSFRVLVDDGAPLVFDEVQPTGKIGWEWEPVYGSFGATIPDLVGSTARQSVFSLTAGHHTISFRGMDPGVRLDAILITNDRNIVPPALTVPADRRINELTPLVVTNRATFSQRPGTSLSFSLIAAPSWVILDPITGV